VKISFPTYYARLAAYIVSLILFELDILCTKNPVFMQKQKKNTVIPQSRIQTKKATLEKINLNVAGIDIGSEKLYVAILEQPVKCFSSFTAGVEELILYLKQFGIKSVVMEATGIYWLPLYEMLEAAGFEVCLVNGAHSKNVPGRKTDVLDAEWLRELHTYGLLRPSFIPSDLIRLLRYYVRLRDDHVSMAASHINHMQKNLDAMNLKLHKVLSDIMGVSGMNVIRAIIAGVRDPQKLLELCTQTLQGTKKEEILLSLKGNYRSEYIFGLKQALELWEYYQEKERECDKQIEQILHQLTDHLPTPENLSKPKEIRSNKPEIPDLHLLMTKLCGTDITQIPGFNAYSATKIISEIGTDLSKFPDAKHFTSWLGLSPGISQSGAKRKNKRRKIINRAAQVLRQLALNVGNGKHTALSSFYKRIRSRAGAMVAIKATARKIAVYLFHFIQKGATFVEEGIKRYEERYRKQQEKFLEKRAKELGFNLVPIT